MIKLATTFLIAASVAAPALAAEPITFERDGIRYVAEVTQRGESQIIRGSEVHSGRAFRLRVNKGRVSGTYNGQPVSYRLNDAPVVTASTAGANG